MCQRRVAWTGWHHARHRASSAEEPRTHPAGHPCRRLDLVVPGLAVARGPPPCCGAVRLAPICRGIYARSCATVRGGAVRAGAHQSRAVRRGHTFLLMGVETSGARTCERRLGGQGGKTHPNGSASDERGESIRMSLSERRTARHRHPGGETPAACNGPRQLSRGRTVWTAVRRRWAWCICYESLPVGRGRRRGARPTLSARIAVSCGRSELRKAHAPTRGRTRYYVMLQWCALRANNSMRALGNRARVGSPSCWGGNTRSSAASGTAGSAGAQ